MDNMRLLSAELLASIAEHVSLYVLVIDDAGVVRAANAAAREVIGGVESHDKLIDGLVFDSNGHAWWPGARARLAGCEGVSESVHLVTLGGAEVPCEMSAFPVQQSPGEVFVLLMQDRSREASQARRVEEKNIQMARMNAELVRSNAELQRSSELKSKFLSIASHELKTPLTLIKGYSDIIIDTMKERLEPDIYGIVNSISRASERLHRVVNNIIDATRLEKGRLKLSSEEFDIRRVLEECIEEYSTMAARRAIRLEINLQGDAPAFYGDRLRMQQVFASLISNALKSSPDGGEVRVRLALESGSQFHLSVSDTGEGVSAEEQGRIFQPFYEAGSITRLSSDPSRTLGGGTGLGLFIVKGIVERHGGRVWVESPSTHRGSPCGSTFHAIMAVRTENGSDDHLADSSGARADAEVRQVVSEPCVVVIDADPEAAEVVRMALEPKYAVKVAGDGGAGLALALRCRPAAVILECELAVIDGSTVCRLLRSQDSLSATALIVLSAWNGEASVAECMASGADDFVVKPTGLSELHDRVDRAVERRRMRHDQH